jgi:large conductance mechanosensitive channel protein
MLGGFRKFVLRGNVVDMAVGVVVGGAFTAVVAALTKDLLTPLIAAIVGKPDFSAIRFMVNGSVFALGDFINAVVSFLLVAASVYFLVIVPIDAATAEGSRLLRKVLADHAHGGMEDVISGLDDSEKEILANLVRKLGHTAEDRAVGEKKTNPPT